MKLFTLSFPNLFSFVLLLAVCVYYYFGKLVRSERVSQPHSSASVSPPDARTTNLSGSDEDFVTCPASRSRGYHQKVIGISLYGDFSDPHHFDRYVTPLQSLAKQVASVYPGWVLRIYHDVRDGNLNNSRLKGVFDGLSNVDLCNANQSLTKYLLNSNTFQMNWRFLPLIDPTVDLYMSRDSDSQIFPREIDAVNDWLRDPNNSTFHIMRDHPLHDANVLGGLWGAKVYRRRSEIRNATLKLLKKKLNTNNNVKGIDQLLLGGYIWPLALGDMVAHDSYLCAKYPNTRPFPTQRKDDLFVGSIVVGSSPIGKAEICPELCRPANHQDWLYC